MADHMGFGTAALALDRLKGHANSYKSASESEILLTRLQSINEYQQSLNQMAENAPSNITFSKKEYIIDGKP